MCWSWRFPETIFESHEIGVLLLHAEDAALTWLPRMKGEVGFSLLSGTYNQTNGSCCFVVYEYESEEVSMTQKSLWVAFCQCVFLLLKLFTKLNWKDLESRPDANTRNAKLGSLTFKTHGTIPGRHELESPECCPPTPCTTGLGHCSADWWSKDKLELSRSWYLKALLYMEPDQHFYVFRLASWGVGWYWISAWEQQHWRHDHFCDDRG